MARESVSLAAEFLAIARRPIVVTDIDGVLAFLTEVICTALNARFDLDLSVAEMTTYRIEDLLPADQRAWLEAQFQRGSFYDDAPPDFHAIDALGAIRAAGLHTVVASDRAPDPTRVTTERWLKRWDVSYDELGLYGRGGKQRILAEYGPEHPAILIDDDPAKAVTIARPGVQVWSPRRPWTPIDCHTYPNYWVFDSWTQVLDRLVLGED